MSERAVLEGGPLSIEVVRPDVTDLVTLTANAADVEIDDQTTYEIAGESAVALLKSADKWEAERKQTVAPINALKDLVQEWYAPVIAAAKLAAKDLGTRQLTYRNAVQREAAEKQAALDKAARELREKLEREAQAAVKAGNVELAEVKRETASVIVAPVVQPTFVQTAGTGSRKVWKGRVAEDLGAFYAYLSTHPEYWNLAPVDEGAANKLAASQRERIVVPGITAFEEESAVQRRK